MTSFHVVVDAANARLSVSFRDIDGERVGSLEIDGECASGSWIQLIEKAGSKGAREGKSVVRYSYSVNASRQFVTKAKGKTEVFPLPFLSKEIGIDNEFAFDRLEAFGAPEVQGARIGPRDDWGCAALTGEYQYWGNKLNPGRESTNLLRFIGRMGDDRIESFHLVIAPNSEFASLELFGGGQLMKRYRLRAKCDNGMLVEELESNGVGPTIIGSRSSRIVFVKGDSGDLRVMVSSKGARLVSLLKWEKFEGEGSAEFLARRH